MNHVLTERGFQVIYFCDLYDHRCSLQQSSVFQAEPPGSSAIWLGIDGDRMHLDKDHVRQLVECLNNWIDHGGFD